MAEYSLTLDAAWSFPLEAYLALVPAMIQRHGGKSKGADHIDQVAIEARQRCDEFLRRHFRILPPGEPAEPNALQRWLADRRSAQS